MEAADFRRLKATVASMPHPISFVRPSIAAGQGLPDLLQQVRACQICAAHLPLPPRPVLLAAASARLLLASQAPGIKVHESGRPFTDASGERLRAWLGIDEKTFYDANQLAIIPMGFCYPGRGKGGDLPPRPECSPAWRASLLARLPQLQLVLAIGQYAVAYHLPDLRGTLTKKVRGGCVIKPGGLPVFPLPHPSPRNNIWLARNPWFEAAVLPDLRQRVAAALLA